MSCFFFCKGYCEFFWKIQIPTITNQPPNRSLYNENVINISKIIVSLDESSYSNVEHILLQNILQDCIWSALLATDIWCLCLRYDFTINRRYQIINFLFSFIAKDLVLFTKHCFNF